MVLASSALRLSVPTDAFRRRVCIVKRDEVGTYRKYRT